MYIGGGRGGPFTVLLGLFIFACILLAEAVKWLLVGAVIAVIAAGRAVRYLYRRHQTGKEHRIRPHGPDIRSAPRPYMSPVRKREYDH